MKTRNRLLALAIMFFVFAAGFSVIFWGEVSVAAKIGLFALGFGSGLTFGGWVSRRNQV
jgi:hypothetical protein